MAKYIWQEDNWPHFTWRSDALESVLAASQQALGRFLGRLDGIGFDLRNHTGFETISEEIINSAAIEGEQLNRDDVRSSVARRMEVASVACSQTNHQADARAEMLLDATRGWDKPLHEARLFAWHAALFPTGYSGLSKIAVGKYRDDSEGPMQVISRRGFLTQVHFEAPAGHLIPSEMKALINWLNADDGHVPTIIRTALAHLRFLTIHPFEDGNGRLARTLTEWMLARGEQSALRFYSLSTAIQAEKSAYYDEIEHAQRNGMDVTRYLAWFIQLQAQAVAAANAKLGQVLEKANFWQKHAGVALNAHQHEMLNRLLDGFEGHLTSSKWAKICKVSQDTASREIATLQELGLLERLGQGRSTHYVLRK